MVLFLSLLFTGCDNAVRPTDPQETPAETPAETLPYEEDGVFVTTSDAMDHEIQNAMFKTIPSTETYIKTPSDITISRFYGAFNGVYVIKLTIPSRVGSMGVEYDYFGEYVFVYSSSLAQLDVYNSNDGEFYSLKKAYDMGLLTIEDIGVIHEKFVKFNEHMYDIDENGEITYPKKPVVEIIDGYYYINGANTFIKAPAETTDAN